MSLPRPASLVSQAAQALREGIAAGRWVDLLPGEGVLCEHFQISRATLRAALQELQREGLVEASQGRRRRILTPVNSGSEPGRRVVLLASAPLERLGAFRLFLVDALRASLGRGAWEVVFHGSPVPFNQQPARALGKLVAEHPGACWVLFSGTAAMQRWFAERGLPCVLAGSRHPGVVLPMVELDCHSLGQHAAAQFLSRGHRRLAVLVPRSGLAGDEQTVAGFLDGCSKMAGAAARVVEHDGSVPGLERALRSLLAGTARPTGLLVTNPAHAVTVTCHLQRAGLRIPADVSLLVRDHDAVLDHLLPRPACYRMRPEVFGHALARAVTRLARQGHRSLPDRHLLPDFERGETLAGLSAKQTSVRALPPAPKS